MKLERMNVKKFIGAETEYLKCFVPMLVDLQSHFLAEYILTFYSAHIGQEYYVSGVGIAYSTLMSILFSILLGYSTVFDCFAGATKVLSGRSALGVLLVKSLLQGMVLYLVILGPYLCSVYLVRLFGDDNDVHDAAILFMRLACFAPLLMFARDLLVKYLVAQDFPFFSLVISPCFLAIFILLGWFNVIYMSWGIYGLTAAYYESLVMCLLMLVLFCVWKKSELEWPQLTSEIFHGWGKMLPLGIYSGIRTFASFGLWAASNILSQSSGTNTAQAVVITNKAAVLFSASCYSGAYAAAIVFGKALALGDKGRIRYYVKMVMFNMVVDRAVVIAIYISTQVYIAGLLTDNQEVIKEISHANLAVAATMFLYSLDELLARGFLTPLAKQLVVGITAPLCIFLLGIPLMVWLILIYRVKTWVIFSCVTLPHVVQCVVYLIRLCRLDMQDEIEKCGERNSICDTDHQAILKYDTLELHSQPGNIQAALH